ncbi:MAG: ubiquinone biosynthesis protein UbiH [Hyphomicrobiaceae bacterium]|nr:MAG: ubiquinone biosynthesis protein UbiH [Hyphomicrobiaceae bacterium]
MQNLDCQVAVIGAGPAGLAAALSLSALGVEVTLAAPAFDPARNAGDRRTTALLNASIELLRNLGVWPLCEGESAPLAGIRIIDDRGGLLRAPEILFEAGELGLTSFGANIPNPALNTALNRVAETAPRLMRCATSAVTAVKCGPDRVRLELAEGGRITAGMAVAADGRNSIARAAAGISTRTWAYPQCAIATSFRHAQAHGGITVELHRPHGPLTTVPMPGSASSLVWVEEPAEAGRLAGLDEAAFAAELEQRLQGLLGAITGVTPRALYPLSGLTADCMGRSRVALVGEAGHIFPPIGAQGLNLGLRDAAALAECVADACRRGVDAGSPATLQAYGRARTADVFTRTLSVDLLNRSLLVGFLPVQAMRGAGLHLLANIPSLRRLVMQAGMAPAGPLPRLMQPGAMA